MPPQLITCCFHLYNLCYGPYKQDSTSTKEGLVLGQNQCARGRTNKTSGIIKQRVTELYSKT